MTRVVLHINNDDMPEVVQQIVFALKETWGDGLVQEWLARIEASRT
jgi:hypothetical protein